MNVVLWVKVAGLIGVFSCGGAGMQPPSPCGQAAGCPLGNCQLASPAVEWPLDPPAPTVTLKVRVPASSEPGKELEYRYFIENRSPADAHHVIVKNPLPANVKFVRASPAPHQFEPELQWHLETMHGGAKCEISLIVLPTGTGDIKNCVRIQYEHGQCVTTRLAQAPPGGEPPLPDGKKPEITPKMPKIEAIPPEKPAKLKLTMEGPKDRYANMPARYFITVVNIGKGTATNLLVRATLPDKTEFISASDDGVHLMSQVAWLLKDLEPGSKRTIELNFKSQGAGLRCVKAAALADGGVSDQNELCTNFVGASALLLELFDRQDPVGLGRDTSFPIIVQNTGTAPVTNLLIRARVPKEMVLARTEPADHKLAERVPQGQWLIFGPATVEPGAKTQFEVFVKAVAAGDARFRVEMTADQLDPARGPVIEEEPTVIYDDSSKIPVKMLSRKKK
jgi:uncharacterized repeat protein (TIGR01451 family)